MQVDYSSILKAHYHAKSAGGPVHPKTWLSLLRSWQAMVSWMRQPSGWPRTFH